MRILVTHSTNEIVQTESSPEVGESTAINGRYVIDVPTGEVDIDATSYVLPVDGNDVSSLAFEQLRQAFPSFENIVFNPLLEATDLDLLDYSAVLDNTTNQVMAAPYTGTFGTRVQAGSNTSSPQPGMAPNSLAILPPNSATTPPRPGVLITDTIDISAATGGLGAETFLVYWKVYQFSTSDDILADYGVFLGTNEPAIRSIQEVEQEPSGLVVAISIDDGITFTPVNRLEVFSVGAHCSGTLPGAITNIRLAFTNTSPDKIYLASYALMF